MFVTKLVLFVHLSSECLGLDFIFSLEKITILVFAGLKSIFHLSAHTFLNRG